MPLTLRAPPTSGKLANWKTIGGKKFLRLGVKYFQIIGGKKVSDCAPHLTLLQLANLFLLANNIFKQLETLSDTAPHLTPLLL